MERLIPRNERLAIVRQRTGALLSRAAVRLLPLPEGILFHPQSPAIGVSPENGEDLPENCLGAAHVACGHG